MELEGHHVASDSVSAASLRDELHEADRRIFPESLNLVHFNALKIAIDELGQMIPAYDHELINQLTAWYDNHPFKERKRSKDISYKVDKPQINMLAGCTPSFLRDTLPEGAWDQGFTARGLFIYSGETFPKPLFLEDTIDQQLQNNLINDLRVIGNLYGKAVFIPEVAKIITAWHMSHGEPRLNHPRLQHYNTRRTAHLIKLCIIAACSRGNDLIISLEDYQQAMDWLTEAELYMPDIFKAMASGGDQRIIEELWHYAYMTHMKDKKPIPEARLINFLRERAPAHSVGKILEVCVRAEIFREAIEPSIGKCYVPRARKAL